MGMLKDALRQVLAEEAAKTGRQIEFIDSPAAVIKTAAQANMTMLGVWSATKHAEFTTQKT